MSNTERTKEEVYIYSFTSHLIAKFEDFLQRLAVGVDHDGVGISVDDFQIHLSHMKGIWHMKKKFIAAGQ